MIALCNKEVIRLLLLAVIERDNSFVEAGERGVVQRLGRQFHRLSDAEVLVNILDNLIRADLTLRRAGARMVRFRHQREPACRDQQQNRKALANLDVQWMGLLSRWMEAATRTLG